MNHGFRLHKIFVVLLLFFVVSISVSRFYAQQDKRSSHLKIIDSLANCLLPGVQDTNRVNVLNKLSMELSRSDLDTSMLLATEALHLAERLKFNFGIAKSYNTLGVAHMVKDDYTMATKFLTLSIGRFKMIETTGTPKEIAAAKKQKASPMSNMGNVYYYKSDFKTALHYYLNCLALARESKEQRLEVNMLGNIGLVYQELGDYASALRYDFQALKLAEAMENKLVQSNTLGNIGIIYFLQAEYSKALKYYTQALDLKIELDDKRGIGKQYSSIGSVYTEQNNLPKAIEYYSKALKIAEEFGSKSEIARHQLNIGVTYMVDADNKIRDKATTSNAIENYMEAINYMKSALKLNEEEERKSGIGLAFGNLGTVYFKLGIAQPEKRNYYFKCSEMHLQKALSVFSEIEEPENVRSFEKVYYELDSARGNFKGAYTHYKLYVAFVDSIANEETVRKQTQLEMQYEFDKKESAAKIAQAKKDAVAEEEKNRQKIVLWCVAAGLLLVLIFAVFIFRAFRGKQKANIEISRQKNIIEEKQKEILDSIHYAKRIQSALLTSERYIGKNILRLKAPNN